MKRFALTAAAATLATTVAFAGAHSKTIVDVAAGDDRFETLVAAVTAADLAETLSGEGPFTVFAPTDDAFAALPEGTVEGLLEPDMKGALTEILTYHVVSGKVMSGDIAMGTNGVDTVAGKTLCITSDGGVTLTDGAGGTATVVIPDIEADNGVIHVIDSVIMPGDGASC